MDTLSSKIHNILRNNDRGNHTVPSTRLYPHMWAWDSAFAAIGWAHFDKERAFTELSYLLSKAWPDGRVPQISFDQQSLKDYFPGPEMWGHGMSSTITQPPAWGLAAERLFELGVDGEKIKSLLPAIEASHQFFYQQRDPLGWNLVAVTHPWESGRDNSPAWDQSMNAIDPDQAPPFERIDIKKVEHPEERPGNIDYQRYICLVDQIKANDFGPSQFQVYDPMMSTVLALSERSLGRLGSHLDYGTPASLRAEKIEGALLKKLWNPTQTSFDFYDVSSNTQFHSPVLGALFPVLLLKASAPQFAGLIARLKSQHLTKFPLSTVSQTSEIFAPHCYWRGPSWVVYNWYFNRVLDGALTEPTRAMIESAGFREYFDPHTGEGLGTDNFTWTAALLQDMLET